MGQPRNLLLTLQDRNTISEILTRNCSAATTERFLILLYLDQGLKYEQIVRTLNITSDKVFYWRKRYVEHGLAALTKDHDRPGKKGVISTELINRVLEKTRREVPENGRRWSTRSMANATGVSASTVRRIWRAYGISPEQITVADSYFVVGEEREKVSQTPTS